MKTKAKWAPLIFLFCISIGMMITVPVPALGADEIEIPTETAEPVEAVEPMGTVEAAELVAPPVQKKKAPRKKKKKLEHAVFQSPNLLVRMLSDDRKFNVFQPIFSFPLPLQFSIYTSLSARSLPTSKKKNDMETFGNLTYLYTPSFYKVGLLGSYLDGGGTGNSFYHMGAYAALSSRSKNFSMNVLPMYLPMEDAVSKSRFHLLWAFNFYQQFGFSGFASYIIREPKNVTTYKPALTWEFVKGLRFIVVYDYTDATDVDNKGTQVGLELKALF